jgi:hypothetical protein
MPWGSETLFVDGSLMPSGEDPRSGAGGRSRLFGNLVENLVENVRGQAISGELI